MKAIRILATGIATLGLAPAFLHAATFTWDGGSAFNDNWTDTANWNPTGAPDPDGSPVADDVIFGGLLRLTPNVNVAHIVNSVTFANTAGAFTIGGLPLRVGNGGITNNDAQTQTFTNAVSLLENAAISATSGGLTFTDSFGVGSLSLTVDGSFATSFAGFTSIGGVTKNGTGTMTLSPSATQQVDLTVNAGAVTLGAPATFGASGSIAVNGGTFNANQNLTLNGGQLSRGGGAAFNLAAGRTLTVQSGGDALFTGSYTLDAAATINVDGAGATLGSTTGLTFRGGSAINITGGGVFGGAIPVNLGGSSETTVIVDGAGSALNTGGTSAWGSLFTETSVIYRNGATGALGAIELALGTVGGADIEGTLSVESDADVTIGNLFVATQAATAASALGTVTVTGVGSTLTQTGASTLTIGTASAGLGSLRILSGGTFTSGTGATTVNAAGTIEITGGTYNANGDVTFNGAQLTRNNTGAINLAPGKTLRVQSGGDTIFSGIFLASSDANYVVTDAGSTLSSSALNFSDGSTLSVLAGGSVTASGSTFNIANQGTGTVVVDGVGATLSVATSSFFGSSSDSDGASVSFRNGASATLGNVFMGGGFFSSNYVWNIESNADVTTGSISIGAFGPSNNSTVTITGAGSTLTQTGASTFTMGRASGNTAVLNVASGGIFNSGTGLATVLTTGTINLTGGAFNANGGLLLDGGKLNVNPNTINFLGNAFTVQNGGDAVFANGFAFSGGGGDVHVTGSGSTITTTSAFDFIFQAGVTLNVSAGGVVSALDDVLVGSGGGAAVNVSMGGMLAAGDDLFVASGASAVATLNITAGGIVSAGEATIIGAGSNASGTVLVDGAGSSLGIPGGSAWGDAGGSASVTFSNSATGTLGDITLAAGTGNTATDGTLLIQSGADVSAGTLRLGDGTGSGPGVVTITGAGSTLTQTGSAGLFIGSGSGTADALNVQNGAAFTSGTGSAQISTTGTLAVNGGSATLNGTVIQNGTITVLNGTVTVNGTFINDGIVLSAGAGGTVRFNGDVFGAGDFLGEAGVVEFAGRYVPGAAVHSITLSANAIFTSTNSLQLKIGGVTAGTQHDELVFTGFGAPHATFGGVLVIDLINGFNPQLGQQFDVFDFDPARVAGTFTSIQLAPGDALAPGLFFSDSQLYTTGVLVVVVPEPSSVLLFTLGALVCTRRRRGHSLLKPRG